MSWDLGPTLAAWLEGGDPVAYRGFVDGDRGVERDGTAVPPRDPAAGLGRGSADRDRLGPARLRAAIRPAGDRDVAARGGPSTCRRSGCAAESGRPLHDPRPVAGGRDARRDAPAVPGRARRRPRASSSPCTTAGCRPRSRSNRERPPTPTRSRAERIEPRLASGALPDDEPPLVVIATDGELYGHHQPFRELFLERLLVRHGPRSDPRSFDVVRLAEALAEPAAGPFQTIAARRTDVVELPSRGRSAGRGECGCVPDGRWKGPLRAALERLAAGDRRRHRRSSGRPGPGRSTPGPRATPTSTSSIGAEGRRRSRVAGWRGEHARAAGRSCGRGHVPRLMEAQRWRLAMFASDGWFWDDPVRPETASVLRAAARAARLVDATLDRHGSAGTPPRRRPGAVHVAGPRDRRRGDLPAGADRRRASPDVRGLEVDADRARGATRVGRVDAAVDAVANGAAAARS